MQYVSARINEQIESANVCRKLTIILAAISRRRIYANSSNLQNFISVKSNLRIICGNNIDKTNDLSHNLCLYI